MPLLAVYGTLKQGNHNHRVHLDREPVFADTVELEAEMYTNGRYPMIVNSKETHNIMVEIYQVTQIELQEIDGLEEPFGYHRQELSLGGFDAVWIYFYNEEEPPEGWRQVVTGNFVKEQEW